LLDLESGLLKISQQKKINQYLLPKAGVDKEQVLVVKLYNCQN